MPDVRAPSITLDTRYSVETPEGIDLQASPAGVTPRALAYAIDLSIRFAVIFVLSMALLIIGEAGMGLLLVVMFLLEWFYPVYFECFSGGQTPGKKQLGIMVVNDDLTPVHFGASLIRNLLKAVDFLPSFYVFGIVSMVLTRHAQRLGDLTAGTLVVHKHDNHAVGSLPDVRAQLIPPGLLLEDKLAIIQFVQRHSSLSVDRQHELVGLLDNLYNDSDPLTLDKLHGVGVSLLGGKD